MTAHPRGFGSDNHAGVLPEVLDAIAAANHGHAHSYGDDAWTERVRDRLRAELGGDAFLVFNGTGANVVALRAMCRPWEGVVCADTAHLNVDEGGAPERVGGIKLLTVPTPDGKLTPDLVEPRLVRFGDEHAVQPRVVSITQSSELGTLYTREEVAALAAQAREHGLLLHVDGARLTNAAAALGSSLGEAAGEADAISFGGTKAGLMFGEAIVLRRPELSEAAVYLRKQSMQLASKMRFVAAQFEALLEGERWRAAAGHANAMARRLADAVGDAVTITQPVEANAVFALVAPERAAKLREEWFFYTWDESTGEVRWMCSWDTTEEDIDAFAAAVRA
ncbi:MAG TPA: aminotransferase class I/II-fold pyridoxal phosphate-dependent enzyme [Solirubrobacteraceae bacterium]|nr:aminotransferase class I/II-fold pyridoxal phosphate-dependent enzyme [Solirubrobacteraceae bacterium]